MGSDFDEGSFKKARSFLMVFSTMLLALWYFNAEMGSLSVLGNSIKFTANTEDLWLILAVANCYFCCRYVQHLPKDWRKPGKDLEALFNSTLCRTTEILYRRKLHAAAWEDFSKDHAISGVTDFKIKPSGSRHYARDESSGFFLSSQPEQKVDFRLPSTWIESNGSKCSSEGFGLVVDPARAVIIYSRVSSFIKGLFLSPWFTEHLFPLIYATCAVIVGLWSWHTVHPSMPAATPTSNEEVYQLTVPANPQMFECLSSAMQSERSVLSIACVHINDVAAPPTPFSLENLAENIKVKQIAASEPRRD